MSSKLVRAACPHDCPDTCAMRVTVEDGRAVKVHRNVNEPTHPGLTDIGRAPTFCDCLVQVEEVSASHPSA